MLYCWITSSHDRFNSVLSANLCDSNASSGSMLWVCITLLLPHTHTQRQRETADKERERERNASNSNSITIVYAGVCVLHISFEKRAILLLPFGSRCVVYIRFKFEYEYEKFAHSFALPPRFATSVRVPMYVWADCSLFSVWFCCCFFFSFVLYYLNVAFGFWAVYNHSFVGFVRSFTFARSWYSFCCHWIRYYAAIYIKQFSRILSMYDSNSLRFSVLCLWLCVAHRSHSL